MAEIAFPALSEAEEIFKSLIWIPATKAAEAALEYYVPFFALPIIKQITEAIIDGVSGYIYSALVLAVDITSIRLVNSVHQAALDDAMVKLKILSRDKGRDSEEYKKELAHAQEVFAKFVRYGATG